MNKYENIIVTGDNKNVYACNFSKEDIKNNSKATIIRYINDKLPCQNNEWYSKDTNALYVINKYLKKIAILSNKGESIPQVKIYVNDSLYKKITSGIYKVWIETGYTKSGKQLDAKEVDEWVNFVNAYKEVFTKVKFFSNTVYSYKQFKFNQEEMKYGQAINNKLKKYLLLEQQKSFNNIIKNN